MENDNRPYKEFLIGVFQQAVNDWKSWKSKNTGDKEKLKKWFLNKKGDEICSLKYICDFLNIDQKKVLNALDIK